MAFLEYIIAFLIVIICIGLWTFREKFITKFVRKLKITYLFQKPRAPYTIIASCALIIPLLTLGLFYEKIEHESDKARFAENLNLLNDQLTNSVVSTYHWLSGRWYGGEIKREDIETIRKFVSQGFDNLEKEIGENTIAILYPTLLAAKHLYEHETGMAKATEITNIFWEKVLTIDSLEERIRCEYRNILRVTRRFKFTNETKKVCEWLFLPFGGEANNTFDTANPKLIIIMENNELKEITRDTLINETIGLPIDMAKAHSNNFEDMLIKYNLDKEYKGFLIKYKIDPPLKPGKSISLELSNNWASIYEASVISTSPDLYSKHPISHFSLTLEIPRPLISYGLVKLKGEDGRRFYLDETTQIKEEKSGDSYFYSFITENIDAPLAFFFLQSLKK